MKLQFDANQHFQLDVVAAVADLVEGRAQGPPEYRHQAHPAAFGKYRRLATVNPFRK